MIARVSVLDQSVVVHLIREPKLSVGSGFLGRARFRAGFGPGSGLSLSKCFGPISGLHAKTFYDIQSKDVFISWCRFVVLTTVTSMSEVIGTFLQLILFENTAAFFCSSLGLVLHCFWEGDSGQEVSTRCRCFGKINHVGDSWVALRNYGLQARCSCLYRYPI